jgi:hypothetical protein
MLSRLLSHEALFQKLYTLGIKGIFVQLIHNMYTHAKFVVKKDHNVHHLKIYVLYFVIEM